MNNERPKQFAGAPRFVGAAAAAAEASRYRFQPAPASSSPAYRPGPSPGKSGRGLGKGKSMKRHSKIQRDTIYGISKGDIRRLARRGGIKRISANAYDDVRRALKERLTSIMKEAVALIEYRGAKTISVRDVIFILHRQGRTIYGFEPK